MSGIFRCGLPPMSHSLIRWGSHLTVVQGFNIQCQPYVSVLLRDLEMIMSLSFHASTVTFLA